MNFRQTLRQYRFLIAFLLATFAGIPLTFYPLLPISFNNFSVMYACVVFTVWYFHERDRLCNKNNKAVMRAIYISVMVLEAIKILRYTPFVVLPEAKKYLWYSYYGPMCAIGTLTLILAVNLVLEGRKALRIKLLCFAVSLLLFSLVMTNDLHYLAFRPYETSVYIDDGYSHGIVFYLVYAWIIIQFSAFFGIIIRHSGRMAGARAAVRPALIMTGYIAYSLLFLKDLLPHAYDPFDMFVVFTMLGIETAILNGLFPVNTRYSEIFAKAPAGAAIYDSSDCVVFTSENYYDNPERGSSYVYKTMKISGGSIRWNEDITAINGLLAELNEINSTLNSENEIITYENSENIKKTEYETKNSIFDEVTRTVEIETSKISQLLETPQDGDSFTDAMRRVCVLMSFIKRRADFAVTGFDREMTPVRNLAVAANEISRYLAKCGLECKVSCQSDMLCSVEELSSVLDVFGLLLIYCVDNSCALSLAIVQDGADRAVITMTAPDAAFSAVTLPDGISCSSEGGSATFTLMKYTGEEERKE